MICVRRVVLWRHGAVDGLHLTSGVWWSLVAGDARCGSLQPGQHNRSVTHTFFWHQQAGQMKLTGASSLAIMLLHITRTFGSLKVLSQPEQGPAQCRPNTSTDCLQTGTLAVLLFAFRDLRQECVQTC